MDTKQRNLEKRENKFINMEGQVSKKYTKSKVKISMGIWKNLLNCLYT